MDAATLRMTPTQDGSAPILQGLRDLQPEIRNRRDEIEKARRIPLDLVDRLRATEAFRLGVPLALGGEQAAPAALMSAIETVSAADGSTGWCTMIAVANGVVAGCMPDEGAREMFADPGAPTAGIASPSGNAVRVNGGVRVTGRWAFASGITHCDWLWAGCIVLEDGRPRMTTRGPEIIYVCMRVADVEVHDTWFVTGLNGTGSNDFTATDVFVPDQLIFDLIDPARHRPEPLYQMPAMGWFASQVACVSLGIARAALDDLVDVARSKVPTLYRAVLAERPSTQFDLAHAECDLAAARVLLYQSVGDIFDTISAGRQPSPRQLAINRLAATRAVEISADITSRANTLAGGSAIYSSSPMQRYARDAEAILHHFTVAPHTWEEAGRVFLGLEPGVPIF